MTSFYKPLFIILTPLLAVALLLTFITISTINLKCKKEGVVIAQDDKTFTMKEYITKKDFDVNTLQLTFKRDSTVKRYKKKVLLAQGKIEEVRHKRHYVVVYDAEKRTHNKVHVTCNEVTMLYDCVGKYVTIYQEYYPKYQYVVVMQ